MEGVESMMVEELGEFVEDPKHVKNVGNEGDLMNEHEVLVKIPQPRYFLHLFLSTSPITSPNLMSGIDGEMKVLIVADEIHVKCIVVMQRYVEKNFEVVIEELYRTDEKILPNHAY